MQTVKIDGREFKIPDEYYGEGTIEAQNDPTQTWRTVILLRHPRLPTKVYNERTGKWNKLK